MNLGRAWQCACCPEINEGEGWACNLCGEEKPLRLRWQRDKEPREYQVALAEACVKKNSLIALPTGLGKTAIASSAAATILSYSEPGKKALFLAPTRPLTLQLASEVRKGAGWLNRQLAISTGAERKRKRESAWESREKVAIFATSNAFVKDCEAGNVPRDCLCAAVIDEVHHAQGEHAHAVAIRNIRERNSNVRMIGLSASPGKDGQAVQAIIDQLHAECVEARGEKDPQVAPYCHTTEVEVRRVSGNDESHANEATRKVKQAEDLLLDELRPIARQLHSKGLLASREQPSDSWLTKVSPFAWLEMRRASGPGPHQASFASAHALSRSIHSLQRYGPSAALGEVRRAAGNKAGKLAGREKVDEAKSLLEAAYQEGTRASPKLAAAVEAVAEHLARHGPGRTRAMVFTSRRESVSDAVNALKRVRGARPLPFVGQAVGVGGQGGMSQREQSAALRAFKRTQRNVLVATSVAEEGLDVANVDLAVIFDAVGARRIAQRMGRAGRWRDGKVVALASQAKEASSYETDIDRQSKLLHVLARSSSSFSLYPHEGPSYVPPGAEVHLTSIDPPDEDADIQDDDAHGHSARSGKPLELTQEQLVSRILHGHPPHGLQPWLPDPAARVYRLSRPSPSCLVRHSDASLALTRSLRFLRSRPPGRPHRQGDLPVKIEDAEGKHEQTKSHGEEPHTPEPVLPGHEAAGDRPQQSRKRSFGVRYAGSAKYVSLLASGALSVEPPPAVEAKGPPPSHDVDGQTHKGTPCEKGEMEGIRKEGSKSGRDDETMPPPPPSSSTPTPGSSLPRPAGPYGQPGRAAEQEPISPIPFPSLETPAKQGEDGRKKKGKLVRKKQGRVRNEPAQQVTSEWEHPEGDKKHVRRMIDDEAEAEDEGADGTESAANEAEWDASFVTSEGEAGVGEADLAMYRRAMQASTPESKANHPLKKHEEQQNRECLLSQPDPDRGMEEEDDDLEGFIVPEEDGCHEEEGEEVCRGCGDIGELLVCELCPAAWHARCAGLEHLPPPEEPWVCPDCFRHQV